MPDAPLRARVAETDGWFSADSAEIYESSTETLFMGRQDAMQRSTLVPLARHLQSAGVQSGAGLKLLEVACGTGRFATYIKVLFACAAMPGGYRMLRHWQAYRLTVAYCHIGRLMIEPMVWRVP